jgi:hypothetical protein
VRRFFAILSIAALPAEAARIILMKDDRFLIHGPSMRVAMENELERVAAFPQFIWTRLSATVGGDCNWHDLRNDCQRAAMRACAYMERDVFAALDTPPHCITQGNIDDNIAALRATDISGITDTTHLKIKRLLLANVDELPIKQAIRLWSNAPCTVGTNEQVHASAACLIRDHPKYSDHTLLTRASLHKLRNMFVTDRDTKMEEKLQSRIDSFKRKRPGACSGLSMLVAKRAKSIHENVLDNENVFNAMKTNVTACAKGYSELPSAVLKQLEDDAHEHAAVRTAQIGESIILCEEDASLLSYIYIYVYIYI